MVVEKDRGYHKAHALRYGGRPQLDYHVQTYQIHTSCTACLRSYLQLFL